MIRLAKKNHFKNISAVKFFIYALFTFVASYILQVSLVIPAFLVSLAAYIKFRKIKRANILNLTLLFMIIFALSFIIVKHRWSLLYIPFSAIPMLATLLFADLEISLLVSLASSVAVASVAGNFYLALIFFISGLISSILVFDARKRIVIIRTGLIIGVVQVLILFLTDRFFINLPVKYITLLANGIASSIVVLGVLPIFEYLFKTVTNISLLELADFHHPLLQRMIIEAPGTYHHSLVVGNLSDAACREVGANALLARIGAYYHDVGKLQKPDYFSENQNIKESKHDALSPSMSKLVIMNHVKEGVELAKKYRLNPCLIDFIEQHHGNSLVYFFYRKAMENLEEDEEIKEEGFRYPGPKPSTKEAAVVLLADSTEAATRTLKEPTPVKIEEVVHKIINNKFIDGQLDECDLTLKDLEIIARVFIRILGGIYHSRINYPEGAHSENNHKKPAKENPHNSSESKKGSV